MMVPPPLNAASQPLPSSRQIRDRQRRLGLTIARRRLIRSADGGGGGRRRSIDTGAEDDAGSGRRVNDGDGGGSGEPESGEHAYDDDDDDDDDHYRPTSAERNLLFRRSDPLCHPNSNDENDANAAQRQQQQAAPPPAVAYHDLSHESPSQYASVAFLNETAVVACDDAGRIDAVRLPRYVPPDAVSNKRTSKGVSSRGTLLSNRVGEPYVTSSHPPPAVRLHPLRNGHAFAAGLPSGEVRLFATERESTWSAGSASNASVNGRNSSNGSSVAPYLNCILRQSAPRRRYHRETRRSDMTLHGMLSRSGVANGGRQPDGCPPSFSSLRRLGGYSGGYSSNNSIYYDGSDHHGLVEVLDWDLGPYAPQRDGATLLMARDDIVRGGRRGQFTPLRNADSLWAFSELGAGSSGGSILAAFVDPELDCFSLRVIDERMAGLDAIPSWGRGSDTKCTVCVDLNSRDGSALFEDITAVTFLGEHTVATAHVACPSVGSSASAGGCFYDNIIKFWDRRMIDGRSPEAVEESAIGPLSPFPLEKCRGLSSEAMAEAAVVCNDTDGHNDDDPCGPFPPTTILGSPPNGARDGELSKCCFAISRLTGSADGTTFSVSMRPGRAPHRRWTAEEELLVDTTRLDVLHRARSHCGGNAVLTPPAYTPNQDFMAAYGVVPGNRKGGNIGNMNYNKGAKEKEESVLLFDLSRHVNGASLSLAQDIGSIGRSKLNGGRPGKNKKKRPHADSSSNGGGNNANGKDSFSSCFEGSIPATARLCDADGLESSLTCLAVNSLGTAVVCGSSDGDLFIWRGA